MNIKNILLFLNVEMISIGIVLRALLV